MKSYFVVVCFALSSCTFVATNSCTDGLFDGNESDIDCGGSCAACANGRACLSDFDCASGFCNGRICSTTTTASCSDGVRNGSESDVDCGGTCPACLPGRVCLAATDCSSNLCTSGRCAMPATSDLPSVPASAIYLVDPGAGVIVDPGAQAGYGITANVGSSFRLIWTGDGGASGTYRQFYGSVWTTGRVVSMTPGCAGSSCALESGDYVSAPYQVRGGQRIDFDSFAFDSIDGFDFVIDTEPAYFNLYIDGRHYPDLVFFTSGGQQSITAAVPFGLRTQ